EEKAFAKENQSRRYGMLSVGMLKSPATRTAPRACFTKSLAAWDARPLWAKLASRAAAPCKGESSSASRPSRGVGRCRLKKERGPLGVTRSYRVTRSQ